MTKQITINGEIFQIVNRSTKDGQRICNIATSPIRYNSIYDAYGRPSDTKVYIWKQWVDWAYSCDNETDNTIIHRISIAPRNSNFFSITFEGTIYDKDCMYNKDIYGLITASYNKVVII